MLRCICTQRTFRCAPRRERSFFTRRGVIQQWWSWLGTLILPLGVVWLNGTTDFPLLGFSTLGLVSRALKGWTLGHVTPHLVCLLWWPMVHLWDIDLPSQLPQSSLSSEDVISHVRPSCSLEEGIEGFYNIFWVRWCMTPSLQLTLAFHSDWFAYFISFWHVGGKYRR